MATRKKTPPADPKPTAPDPTPRPANDPEVAAYDAEKKAELKEAEKPKAEKKAEPVEKAFELGDIERVLATGNLSKLTPDQRAYHLLNVCRSLGLNHLTRPFDYLNLDGKLVLYARRDCTDQLRKLHGVSVIDVKEEFIDGLGAKGEFAAMRVTVKVEDRDGRKDMDYGVVVCHKKMSPLDFANAMKKAMTQAKRRATLSLCGLGMLDDSELADLPDQPPPAPKALPAAEPDEPSESVAAKFAEKVKAEVVAETKRMKALAAPKEDVPVPPLGEDAKPSDAMFKLYEVLCGEMLTKFNIDRDKIKKSLKKEFGVDSSRDLTAVQLSNVIDRMSAKLSG